MSANRVKSQDLSARGLAITDSEPNGDRPHQSNLSGYVKMRRVLFMVAWFCCALFGADFRVLSRVHTVYVVGMSSGLDQYLSNRLTSNGIVWIVLDPARADAILTDRLDEIFWAWLNERYPLQSKAPLSAHGDDLRTRDLIAANSRMRGNLFLIDPKSRLVLWSCYDQAKNTSAGELDHVAMRVTKRLKVSLGKK